MFVRDKEGNVEEGNEVKFQTCGWEETDEDDNSRGPRAAAPECGGAVDTFYRDVNGDLGHQSWSKEGNWSTDTLPAAIARSSIPRVIPRTDGSRIVDAFYREVDGDLGHQWWTPGTGWQGEERALSMASDPNVITRLDGTIDVFYRTTGGELGHEWWVPGVGWSSEIRPATVSSDPHAVIHKDGSVDVVYRSGSGLGRDHWTSKGGWTHEVRSGSLAAEPRPLVLDNGVLDVYYRTTGNKLAHDFFVPGVGWARETRTESLASDPHVVKRPHGTIDVFWRTPGKELGHMWWVSGSGWATETRPGNLSSDPHAIARSDGSVEVFYRDGTRVGHQWFVPGTGWSAESRRGPIAWHSDPHVVTQSDGRIDVIYETPKGEIGRDYYIPGGGWRHEIRPTTRVSRPVAAYSFDAGEGSVAEDAFGDHDGAIEGPEWTSRGKYGSTLSFKGGEKDCVSVEDASELQLDEDFTLEAWVKPEGEVKADPIIFKESENFFSYFLGLGIASGGKVEAYIGEEEEGHTLVASPNPLPVNVWAHVALTYDGAQMRLYLNGQLVDTNATGAGNMPSIGPLQIGCADLFNEYFNGLIDEPRIYDRALNAGEINADKAKPVQTPPRPPVAAYSFEAGEGELAEDLFGGHDGTLEGAEWFDKGRFGSALLFDGEETCVTVPHAADLELSEEMTVEAWVRPHALVDQPILFKGAWGNPAYALGISFFNTAKAEGLIGEGPGKYEDVVSPEAIEENVWSHIAFTYDGATMRLYVNGILVATQAQSTPPPTGEGPLAIGCNPLYPEDFDGLIDEVRIYDRALDEGEIAADKATPLQTPSRGPLATYSFDAGEGEVAQDFVGGHDGTLNTVDWVNGKYGKALYFDGAGDYVEIPDHAELQLGDEFTLESWVRPDAVEDEGAVISKTAGSFFSYQLYAGSREFAGIPEGFLGYEPWAWDDVEDESPLVAKTWSHIALTYDGSLQRLYVNGELVDTSYEPTSAAMASVGPLYIGGNEDEEDFKGRIDEVRIYDRALDAGEVNADKAQPVEAQPRLPVAAYSFDAGAGELAEDLFGNHDGTLEGAEWFDKGRFGSALLFDGEETCVTVPHAADLQLSEEMTVEAWVKPHYLSDQPIIYKSAWGNLGYAMGIDFFNASKPEGLIGEGPGKYEDVVSSQAAEENAWSHLAFTYDGATMRLYINGELVGSQAQSTPPPTGEGPLAIGCNPLYPEDFDGLIDEVRIYDRALDAGEIAADKVTPLQTPPREPVASYSFDAGEGAVAEDFAGGHDGAIEGAEWSDRGRFGSALLFDGPETCVTVPHAEDLQLSEEMTVEAWVKPDALVDQPIIYKSAWGNLGYAMGISYFNTAKAEGLIGEGPGKYEDVVSPEAIEENVWSHIAFTYDGTTMRLYVNGTLVASQAQSTPPPTGEGPLAIGCNPLYPEDFDGLIDEVRIYDRALDEGEINTDMGAPVPTG
ncbi:MAG TPA: LamG-like jellyroll fold domain-containing protein [Solirubrobacterales bacterium]|nr:LamG-like jellyroll fold domain-containing protein [Solirubrobacterales bacterium]